jgi:subtilisin
MTERPPGTMPPLPSPLAGLAGLVLLGLLLFGLLQPPPPEKPLPAGALFPRRALVGEEVRLGIGALDPGRVRVSVEGVEARVVARRPGEVRFLVPEVPGGPRRVRAEGSPAVEAVLGVLGQVVRDEALLFLPKGASLRLPEGFGVLEARDLGPCGGRLYRVSVGGLPLGLALERLAAQDAAYRADPESLWSLDALDPAQALGAKALWERGFRGRGVAVAVLDTGVGEHPFLEGRRLPGADLVDGDALPEDAFPGGHGTGVAGLVLAVAPEARVLPVRVCDAKGVCRASRVVQGVCYALERAPRPLVLNLSLGGDTPVEALEAILRQALSEGVPVVAAAGNQGKEGPAHYPAAWDLPGLLAVGALDEGLEAPAPFSTWGGYVDLAAPGEGLPCPAPGGGMASCRGTSFAAPLAAGALALLLEARPGLSPEAYARLLQEAARPLPFPKEAVGAGALDLARVPLN